MPTGRIVTEIVYFLLFPLAAGMVLRRAWPDHAPRTSRFCIRISTLCLAIFVVGALASGRLQVTSFGWRTPLALLLFGSISMWIGVGVSRLFRLPPGDRFAVAIEVVVRNGNLGLLLKAALFPAVAGTADPIGDGVLYVVLFYAGLSLALGLYEVVLKRLEWRVLYRANPAVSSKK